MQYESNALILDFISSDKSEGLFDQWKTHDDNCYYTEQQNNKKNKKVYQIELHLFVSLRYLGRGWTFDDMHDGTLISRDVHRKIFHQFVKFGATVLYPKYVSAPKTMEKLRDCKKEYIVAGFPGCIDSTDETHISQKGLRFISSSASWLQVKKCDADVQSSVQSSLPNLTYNIWQPW